MQARRRLRLQIPSVVVEAMNETKIDLSMNHPKMFTMQMVNEADLVVTMGCSVEVCPARQIEHKITELKALHFD